MPKGDGEGPPAGAQGPRDGGGRGQGWAPGQGAGSRSGGSQGDCETDRGQTSEVGGRRSEVRGQRNKMTINHQSTIFNPKERSE